MAQPSPESERALVTIGTHPVPATRDNVNVMDRFVQIMDPAAPPKARWALAVVACRLGLHPLNNEVILYEGQPYITIQGRRRLAERSHDVAAVQPWIITDKEERAALGASEPGDVVAGCRLFRRSSELPTIQYGMVRQFERWPSEKEMQKLGVTRAEVDKLRVANNPDGIFALIKAERPPKVRPVILQPQTMAMKRAEARALDSLAGVPLPTYDAEIGAPIAEAAMPPQLVEADDGSGPPADGDQGAPPVTDAPPPAAAGERPWQPGEGPMAPTEDPQGEDPEDPPPADSQGSLMGRPAPRGGAKE